MRHIYSVRTLKLRRLRYWYRRISTKCPFSYKDNDSKSQQQHFDEHLLINFENFHRIDSAEMYREKLLLQNTFEHWKIYAIHKLQKRIFMCKAAHFYRSQLQKKVFDALLQFVSWSCHDITNSIGNELDNCNTAHYDRMLLQKYFYLWSKYIKYQQIRFEQMARMLCANLCLKKAMTIWKIFVAKKKDGRNSVDKADVFYKSLVLRKTFEAWSNTCSTTVSTREKFDTATLHHEERLRRKVYNAWIQFHTLKIQNHSIYKSMRQYYINAVLRKTFQHFVLYKNTRNIKRTERQEAENYWQQKLKHRVFHAWRIHNAEQQTRTFTIKKLCCIMEDRMKRQTLFCWRTYLYHRKYKAKHIFMALNHYSRRLKIHSFTKLRSYTTYRRQKKLRLLQLNVPARMGLRMQMFYIDKWKRALSFRMQEKRRMCQANKMCEMLLERRYFSYWKLFSRNFKFKNVLKTELNDLASKPILKKYLSSWYTRYINVLHIRKKADQAVLLIRQKTLRKFINLWRTYIMQKKQNLFDINAAKELHKAILLKEGLQEVLKTCLYSIQQHQDVYLRTVKSKMFGKFEILNKFFYNWLSLTGIRTRRKLNIININRSHENVKIPRLILPEYMLENINTEHSSRKLTVCKQHENLGTLALSNNKHNRNCTYEDFCMINPVNSPKCELLYVGTDDTFNKYSNHRACNKNKDHIRNFQSPVYAKGSIMDYNNRLRSSIELLPPSVFM